MSQFTPEFFEAVRKNIVDCPIEYLRLAGVVPEVLEERHIRMKLEAGKMHLNHVNIMYAGSYFVFAESAGANLIACTYGGQFVPIIASVNVNYLKPSANDLIIDMSMTEEEAAERIAPILERGKGRYPLTINVMDSEGTHCAQVEIVYYLMPAPKA